ncbi:MAG: hypothetical protein H6822_06580 [Planctomycetaceae bacterium]|nr:hypothetical protein [Planctomycetales bacterium]MCB9921827.1 hypothetical protein [Planctomycetaceae bacterium]
MATRQASYDGDFVMYRFMLVVFAMLGSSVSAQTVSVPVEIQSVDIRLGTISVRHNGKVSKLTVTRDAKISVEGKESRLADLKIGDDATVEFDKSISAVTKVVANHTPIAPAEKLEEGWETIDERLLFLMVRLASTEASLDAIEAEIFRTGGRKYSSLVAAKRAEESNDRMDRRGGGPIKWSQFYGHTAESFFYHPTDRNSTYHTVTVLSQRSPKDDNQVTPGVPSRQGLPVHQRPPQFDYIYRANQSAKARAEAEAAELRGKIELLLERRRRLEAEQSSLWCEIAFRAISH